METDEMLVTCKVAALPASPFAKVYKIVRPRGVNGRKIEAPVRKLSKVTVMNRRRLHETMHVRGDAIEPVCRIGVSQDSVSREPKRGQVRVLSVDAVVDDMRAILWPDRCD